MGRVRQAGLTASPVYRVAMEPSAEIKSLPNCPRCLWSSDDPF
jgi:hypothetical protein